jgi:hypothetical protein
MLCWHFTCCVGGNYSTADGWWHGIPHGIFHTRPLPDVQHFCCIVSGTFGVLPVPVPVYLGRKEEGQFPLAEGQCYKKRRGKSDTGNGNIKDDAKNDDEEDVLPVTVRLFERSSGRRGSWLRLIQSKLLRHINSNSCRGLFHPNQPMMGRKDPGCCCCVY